MLTEAERLAKMLEDVYSDSHELEDMLAAIKTFYQTGAWDKDSLFSAYNKYRSRRGRVDYQDES